MAASEHAWADAIVNVRLFQRTLRVVENKFRDFARRVNEGAKMKGQGMDGAREVRRRMLDVASGVKVGFIIAPPPD